MADIDPLNQAQQFTPRQADLVDAIAETKRVTEAAMRSNPLRNAIIDGGLMKWRGNYSGGGLNGTFLWIGDFYPNDGVLDKPQRGFLLSRDDPKHAPALWMYDGYESNPVNAPMRQRLYMKDADDRNIMIEGFTGGKAFPWTPIPLYPQIQDQRELVIYDGTNYQLKNFPIIGAINGIVQNQERTLYRGFGPMTGNRIRYRGTGTTTGPWYGVYLQLTFNNSANTQVNTNRIDSSGAGFFIWDVDLSAYDVVGSQVDIRVIGVGLPGGPPGGGPTGSDFTWVYVEECCSFSNY